jgi:hypothetical protein
MLGCVYKGTGSRSAYNIIHLTFHTYCTLIFFQQKHYLVLLNSRFYQFPMAAQTAKTQYIEAANGVKFAYRLLGNSSDIPLVMHCHFRSNMDYWVRIIPQVQMKNC